MKVTREVKYGLLHNHTDNSLRDSAMSVEMLVNQAKKMGAPAVALTDHGVMTGYINFMQCCNDNDIKPILGVELYVEEEHEGRKHLVIMAKNKAGFQSLIKAVSETSHRMYDGYPRANKELLMRFFGPQSSGHGNVIATSACVQGVLASVIMANRAIEDDIKAIQEEQAAYTSPDSASYQKSLQKRDALEEERKKLAEEITALKKMAEKSTKGLLRKAETGKDEAKRAEARAAYEEEERKKTEAAKKLEEIQSAYNKNAADIKILKSYIASDEKQIAKWKAKERQIQEIRQRYIDDKSLNNALIAEAEWYDNLFGHGNFYIELQNHGLAMEKEIYPKLAWLSDWLGIPVVAANDAHIPDNSPDSVLARSIMQSTRFQYQKWYEPKKADCEVYLKTDQELFDSLCKIIPKDKAAEAMENVKLIVDACNFELEKGTHYPKFVTPDGTTPEEYLRKMAYDGIAKRYPDGTFSDYERLEYELGVICSMGYADYHCIVEDLLRYVRSAGKLDLNDPREREMALSFDVERIEDHTANRVGEYVGPGRGSAAGSLVCYLIGITNIDPLKYGLLFERFLNPDRVSMPDIDCDIETKIRPYAVEYVKNKYGKEAVCGIMTRGKQKGKAALITAAKTYALKKGKDSMHFMALEKVIATTAVKLAGSELNLEIHKIADDFMISSVDPNTGKQKEEKISGLKTIFAQNRDALEIIHFSLCVEGSAFQVGQHPAGVIITDGKPVDDYVPLIMSNKGTMMTSCDMEQVEHIGLLKVDFLGLRNLTIISNTLKRIYRDLGIAIDMDTIPMDDKDVYREIFSKANTNSVFQFESEGMKKMLKEFKPGNIFDLILLVAMYRPGPMQFLNNVIEIKSGRKTANYLTPELEPILKNTYAAIAYQEQVQEIFKKLAGYSLGQADLVRRAMSKKKESVLEAERRAFIAGDPERNVVGCKNNGISEQIANTLFDELMDFSKYAFNKSHAVCYAVVAYQTAWLKYHYPIEYMCEVLNMSDFDDVPKLCRDLRYMRIPVEHPDINISENGFSIYNGKIYFGLNSIKGLGESCNYIVEERHKNGPYLSIADFVKRTLVSGKIYESFVQAGAFDQFCGNRKALLLLKEVYMKHIKSIKDGIKKLDEIVDNEKRKKAELRIKEKEERIYEIAVDDTICDDNFENLKKEKECLGEYLSGHPLDYYPSPEKLDALPIYDVLTRPEISRTRIIGIISNYKEKNRKSDGKQMAFFDLSDKTGTIPVCCFTKQYATYGRLLADDIVIVVEGNIMSDEDNEFERKLSVEAIKEVNLERDTIMIYDSDPDNWQTSTLDRIIPYSSKNGNPVQVYFSLLGEIRETDLLLNPQIVKDQIVKCSLQKMKL